VDGEVHMKQLTKEEIPKLNDLYDNDFYAWAMKTAELVSRGRFQEVNPTHVAEELEDLGRSEKREMASRLERWPPIFSNGRGTPNTGLQVGGGR
jgi:hypothetical protein